MNGVTIAFSVLGVLGLAALLAAIWLLVAGERRRLAASCLTAGLLMVIGAAAVAVVNHESRVVDCDVLKLDAGDLPALPPPGSPPPEQRRCDDVMLFGGALNY